MVDPPDHDLHIHVLLKYRLLINMILPERERMQCVFNINRATHWFPVMQNYLKFNLANLAFKCA